MYKFLKLEEYLDSHKGENFILSFTLLEEIIGTKLCNSAYKYSSYWSKSKTHSLPNLIYNHHFLIEKVSLNEGMLYLSYDGRLNFKDYIIKNTKNIRTAYIDSSYKKYYLKENGFILKEDNTNLAKLGKSLYISLLIEKYLDKENIDDYINVFSSNYNLVNYVARHFKLLSLKRNNNLLVKYDYLDNSIPTNYDYSDSSYDYIANIIYALLGAIYLDNKYKNNKVLVNIVNEFIKLIPNNRNK